MNRLLLLNVVLATFVAGKSEGLSSTRDENIDAPHSTNKRPRDVETVARLDYRRHGQLHGLSPDVPKLVDPNERVGNLLDISEVDVEIDGQLPGFVNGDAYWSIWSEWTGCSRTCGGGVSSRARKCISRYARTTDAQCEGSSAEHNLCNSQECPEGSQDLRELQCSQQNGEVFMSRNFKWIPFSGKDGNTCELSCMATNFHFYHSFGPALDGTRCGTGRKGICIKGECMKIGCDHLIGSDMTEDACGVCGGSNVTCSHYQNVIDRLPGDQSLNSDYYKVATIPVGATHIYVKDHNRNYLALAENDDGNEKYIINGNWVISWPGEFKTAGTVVSYDRVSEKETFDIVGPTKKELHIMVLCLGQQPLIEYEYWISKQISTNGFSELKVQRKVIIHVPNEEDFRAQIKAAGLDFDAVKPPTLPPSTTTATSLPTTTTTLPEATVAETSQPGIKLPSVRPSYCTPCKKTINRKKHFCDSDFVVHARVLTRRRLQRGRYVGYEVEILNNYKSELRMMRREYIWVSSTCCPRLRPYRHYLLMGRNVKVDVTGRNRSDSIDINPDRPHQYETRLIADHTEFWYTWRKNQIRMARAAKHINCKRYRYLAAKFYRRKHNEG